MKKTLIPLTAVAVSAAAFVGCEWGGAHRGDYWNDAYSWANFSGTYKLAAGIDSSSTATGTTETSSKQVGNAKSLYWSEGTTLTLDPGLVKGSISVKFNGFHFSDNGDGTLSCSDTTVGGSGSYSADAGTVNISFTTAVGPQTVHVSYSYNISTSTSAMSGGSVVESPITWLNVNQKGNLLTIEDNNGTIYNGKITGASCPTADNDGYVQAAHIRFPFEATSTNGRVTLSGSLSGDWSGGSSRTSGTLANRTIDANYHRGKTTIQFRAVSGTVTLLTTVI